ncbi:MAG: NAD(P)-dependent oxidoreductase [Meiothermus sp.]|uniref:NAD-dependent epimerase/dehydratase family protein n=1 Tax=Meiothermus sp. TaxID=1955249 RepID=UPI0025F7B4EC|nr:NAD(P)-dependent oxidoreductase [Meiothermus sp.]MCS7068636.1 NAD(P)-dependent oxidoreductase [Meiothermus sp.]MDW8424619.1 NAD(P)-dependent oxidoreductase [Meiothermus sp.]
MITGAGGFVGRAITAHLQEAGFWVEACDLQNAPRAINVLEKQALLEITLETRPHTFIHAAALTSGEDLQVIKVNVQGTLNALQAARRAGVRHFVLFSSCAVYAPSSEPTDESGPTTTTHAYALSKLLSEQAVELGKASMTAWLLRIGAVYGPAEQPSATRSRTSVVHQIAESIRTGQRLRLQCAPHDVYNWLHTQDLARLLSLIIEQPADGKAHLYNVAGPSLLVADLVSTFQALKPEIDLGKLIEYNPHPPPRHGAIDSAKAKSELGFSPAVQLEDGLLDYLARPPLGRGPGVRETR